ncbi:MAG: insulinase family protein [Marinifilaceae bacterium]|jgi:predicted Zn-dependent peptidase|nr:insulinase family protein [Marinifilaceae bacterium]
MIKFNKFKLDNGLKVIVHEDNTSSMAGINLLYNVGSKNENPNMTGFAHLFEHLMFSGSENINDFDGELQKKGGESNAWTNTDLTNYYITIPKENIETAFWVESDRMMSLNINQNSLDVQKSVVIEEFKQRYFNQPYGDIDLHLRPLVYKNHPYSWPTIGKCIEHIQDAKLEDVKNFYNNFYSPDNAVLVVSGNVKLSEIEKLSQKWFSDIDNRNCKKDLILPEPIQQEYRSLRLNRAVPLDSIYMNFRMPGRNHKDFYIYDIISDILSNGDSSRLFTRLVKDEQIFSSIDAYITAELECGLFKITGKLNENTSFELAEQRIWIELNKMVTEIVEERELEKLKNKAESAHLFQQINYMNKAMNLAMFEICSDASDINKVSSYYRSISQNEVQEVSKKIFVKENCSTVYYAKK